MLSANTQGGLVLEDVVIEGAAVLETHVQLRRCRIRGVEGRRPCTGVGVCVQAAACTISLEQCDISGCLVGIAVLTPACSSLRCEQCSPQVKHRLQLKLRTTVTSSILAWQHGSESLVYPHCNNVVCVYVKLCLRACSV